MRRFRAIFLRPRCVTAFNMMKHSSWNKVSGCGQSAIPRALTRPCSQSILASPTSTHHTIQPILGRTKLSYVSLTGFGPVPATLRSLSSPSEARKKRALDIDTVVSVLESSATKRDARGYLQKYVSEESKGPKGPKPKTQSDQSHQTREETIATDPAQEVDPAQQPSHVAIVTLRVPQYLDEETITGVAKTLSQLRMLGLLSVVVLDCGAEEARQTFEDQAWKLCEAIDTFSKPGSKLHQNSLVGQPHTETSSPSILEANFKVDDLGQLRKSLQNGLISVIPSLARPDNTRSARPVDAHQVVLTLTKYLSGMQFASTEEAPENSSPVTGGQQKIASVERLIILEPLGGTPVPGRPGASHRFVNLEQEYDVLLRQLMGPEGSPVAERDQCKASATIHASNLNMAKEALSVLPSTSSALITTPLAAANLKSMPQAGRQTNNTSHNSSQFGFNGMVTTRKRQNPLLHNLLTDKPIYSSSLPVQRIQDGGHNGTNTGPSSAATLIKRGMPLTIYPDPQLEPWTPPPPNGPRLRLTDNCIDLPRLNHLIEDSFNRKLDLQDYLKRVNENLAGIIIAGEYEGGAILTWEQPAGLDYATAYEQGRLVPYLDKFAVLKSRQGSGGVADVVFNAMVGDCFPDGVCWRSRKDNPVNKWYFERSAGTNKLGDSNWTMFWTTLGLNAQHPQLKDYESVCRAVEPSWADNKHILD